MDNDRCREQVKGPENGGNVLPKRRYPPASPYGVTMQTSIDTGNHCPLLPTSCKALQDITELRSADPLLCSVLA
jgi:hypothetical protein